MSETAQGLRPERQRGVVAPCPVPYARARACGADHHPMPDPGWYRRLVFAAAVDLVATEHLAA